MAHRLLRITCGIEIPDSVTIGDDLVVHHSGFGLVVHPFTTIGDRVHLFQGVTIGRSDVWVPRSESPFEGIDIEDDVWVCSGAQVIGGSGRLRVGRGTIVGANAVLLESTGEWEIWAGAPARCVGLRQDRESAPSSTSGEAT
jgi:serine O-acetyltransferase